MSNESIIEQINFLLASVEKLANAVSAIHARLDSIEERIEDLEDASKFIEM